jgi:hypothetical protein
MRAMAQTLADRGALRPDLTPSEAADILWLLNGPGRPVDDFGLCRPSA